MLFIHYSLILLLSQRFTNGVELFFGIRNGFKYLNDELDSVTVTASLDAKTRWFEQNLDNFDLKETRKWNMRYFESLVHQKHRKSGIPIYLLIGGESAASPSWTVSGIMYELAKETQGAMFVSEHRYYGLSKPLNGTDADSFKFLSSRQALADNANLLRSLKSLPLYKKSKVVVIGGSYAGNLAGWMKLLYPDLVDAAIASSGPVLAKVDFSEYLEKVNDNYENHGTDNCLDAIRNVFQRYDSLLKNSKGTEQLKAEENICNNCNMSIPENQQLFFSDKISEFMSNSQYGTTKKIKKHCETIQNRWTPMTMKKVFSTKNCVCYDFNGMIDEMINNKENDWILAWFYQTCTEFGYYQTTSSPSHPFTKNVPVEFYTKMCSKLFGPEFDMKKVEDGVTSVNNLYGGLKPNVSNVIFTNGDLDPWSNLSVLEDLSYDAPAVLIPRSSHCRDLFSNQADDIEELKEARKHIKYVIKKWIKGGDYLHRNKYF